MRGIVMIVDDHPLVGEGFQLSIGLAYPHLEVGRVTSATAAEAYARANAARIKLVMLDLMLPDAKGFSALLRLQQLLPNTPIAIVSARADAHTIAMARTFGVAAYLSKSQPVSSLVNSVGDILRGEAPFAEPSETETAQPGISGKMATLSAAQLRILVAMADGRLNKQIGAELNITEGTVKQHVSAIFRKLGVNNRSQALLAVRPFLSNTNLN
ncbi:DNA-binding response regulator [Brevundimonas sp. TWP2-3-4b1]|uniref:response regulator transcription factor n=1 Tax=Brevundimonas sp. TWP2-3-4b1 TaxID=2804580 RepID=UPI003CF310DB